jgi:hypothetical protein
MPLWLKTSQKHANHCYLPNLNRTLRLALGGTSGLADAASGLSEPVYRAADEAGGSLPLHITWDLLRGLC